MSEPQGSLIYLMRLLEGHLSASESTAARRRLDAADWRSAWERLQLAAVETTLPVATWEEPTVPAETLAAFLEGTLSLTEAARVERSCWDSPELLREFVSSYRFLHADTSAEAAWADSPSGTATDRLMALFPESASEPAGRADGDSARTTLEMTTAPPPAGAAGTTAVEPPGANLPVVVNVGRRANRVRRRSTPIWFVYAATIVIGLGLGLGAVIMISRNRDNAPRSNDEIVSPSDGQRRPAPNSPGAPEIDPPGPEGGPRPGAEPPQVTPSPLPGPPFDVVEDHGPPPGTSDPLPQPPQRPSPTAVVDRPPDRQSRSLAVQWEKIDGLLVARDDDRQPWHGPYADVHHNASSNYATLPESWASAKTTHGRVVLAEDTQVRLNGTRDSIQMNVERGRVAISEIPDGQKVDLQVGAKSWIIQPMEADTALGCTVFARQTQLVVRRGRVSIAGTEIVAGRQVLLAAGGLGKPAPIDASTSWFTRPDKTTKAPAATRAALLASRDVRADLAAIWRTDDHPARLFAARWSLAIAGDQTLAQALSARDDKLRLVALNWLLSCPPNDPRVLQALRKLAQQTADPQMVRNVLNWLRSARTKSRVTRADADRMVAGLRSDHLAIRQISAFFLETAFGKRVVFSPTSGPAARQLAAREWTAILDRADRAGRGN